MRGILVLPLLARAAYFPQCSWDGYSSVNDDKDFMCYDVPRNARVSYTFKEVPCVRFHPASHFLV